MRLSNNKTHTNRAIVSNSHVSNQYSFRINNLSWRFWSVNQQKKTYASSTVSTTSTSSSKFYMDDDDDEDDEDEEVMNIPEEPLFKPQQQEKGKTISLLSIMLQQEKEYKAIVLHRCKRYHHHLNELFSASHQQERS
ncbi:uncharacterized protein RHIMIDRAFT_251150 [Rhizopus microsporus ATCC 52813]|uniref:Nitrogen regulatory protein areA GATA-like domain-containing protein n=1 Tax=Rhizopus microsporus ATCC 52813 TaxID=1340429 RepID=A0A2G4SWE7_RHIZD|nr:uncharacterized protein RHIMIDRAFT_251150 [Rhizopus microsporus ATCC 52813]PHZ13062.1 hypothetical protein RHIMIDRAFT_251150 [Rhizopus microsporus ATCC 52813]